jgi:hypothetical protein
MAILLELATGDTYMDIVSGGRCAEVNLTDVYTTLIRPGDGCRVQCGRSWEEATYYGLTGNWAEPFYACVIGDTVTTGHSTIRPLPAAETKPEAETETGQHFNALEYWLTHGLKREQEWDKIRQIFRNALGDNPGCPFCLSYISEPEPNPLLTRLTAAEQELAAIRAEIERSAK